MDEPLTSMNSAGQILYGGYMVGPVLVLFIEVCGLSNKTGKPETGFLSHTCPKNVPTREQQTFEKSTIEVSRTLYTRQTHY
jgi:hypothetical protein